MSVVKASKTRQGRGVIITTNKVQLLLFVLVVPLQNVFHIISVRTSVVLIPFVAGIGTGIGTVMAMVPIPEFTAVHYHDTPKCVMILFFLELESESSISEK